MKEINWKETYPNLPLIPSSKRWFDDGTPGTATLEQIISHKLHFKEPISAVEEKAIEECINFYDQLAKSLKRFNFSAIKDEDVEDFLRYIEYAYNYLWLHSNEIELFETYRLVNNSDGKSKECIHQLSYPSLNIVREKNVLNRASSSKSTVFYCSESIDLVFKELRPPVGSIVTLGIWRPIGNRKLLSYPIMGNPSAQFLNKNASASKIAFNEMKKRFHPLFGLFMDGYFNVLNHEFSKPINNKKEYLVSSLFSERIFEERESEWTYDCIVYPSVGDEYSQSNFAIKPKVVDSKLHLAKAFEFEVVATFYEQKANKKDPRKLSVVNARVIKESRNISTDGRIEWK